MRADAYASRTEQPFGRCRRCDGDSVDCCGLGRCWYIGAPDRLVRLTGCSGGRDGCWCPGPGDDGERGHCRSDSDNPGPDDYHGQHRGGHGGGRQCFGAVHDSSDGHHTYSDDGCCSLGCAAAGCLDVCGGGGGCGSSRCLCPRSCCCRRRRRRQRRSGSGFSPGGRRGADDPGPAQSVFGSTSAR